MSLEQYLVPVRGPSLCNTCGNYAGGCPWTEAAEDGSGTRFAPVPGWKAQRSHHWPGGWHVMKWPLYREDTVEGNREASEEQRRHYEETDGTMRRIHPDYRL